MKLIVFLFLPTIMILIGFLWQVKTPQSQGLLVQIIKGRLERKRMSVDVFFEVLGRRWIWEGLALAMVGISLYLNTGGTTLKEIIYILIFKIGIDLIAIFLTLFVSLFE